MDNRGTAHGPFPLLVKAFVIWLTFILLESLHGTFRVMYLEPRLGIPQARRLSLFTGSLLCLVVVYLMIGWLKTDQPRILLQIGLFWTALTLLFEFALGRFVMGRSWDSLLADYNPFRGGLMLIALAVMMAAPFIAVGLHRLRIQTVRKRR